jgi:teichuronic acid biosynthesis glycosyltransferase TuaG
MPETSIITPVFNSEKFLNVAIESVISQSYEDWEMILIDDCSTDSSLFILESYQHLDSRIKIYRNAINSGSGFTRNRAIQLARGQYIAFLDSDDCWHKDKLKIQIDYMKENHCYFTHTSYGYINEYGDKIKYKFQVSSNPISYRDLLKRTEISCLTAVYDSLTLGKFYMSEHRRKQDYALWLKILKSGVVSYPIDIELAYYRQSKNSATSNKWSLIAMHVIFLKETQGMNILESLYYTFYWMMNGFMRYYIK